MGLVLSLLLCVLILLAAGSESPAKATSGSKSLFPPGVTVQSIVAGSTRQQQLVTLCPLTEPESKGRYYINSSDYSILSTRSSIRLEYEGTSFSSWSVPESCKVQNSQSPTTKLHCASAGIHTIKPNVGGQVKERHLSVGDSHICFLWYFKVLDNFEDLTQTVTVWVYDPESSSKEELQWTAEKPSLNSKILTILLNTLGQHPYINTVVKRISYEPSPLSSEGTWNITLPMTSDDALKEIRGTKVAFQDCFISNLIFLLTYPLMTLSSGPTDLPLTLPAGSPAMLSASGACVSSFSVLVTEEETFQTNDSFHTWTRIRVPPGILSAAERHNVSGVAIFKGELIFIISGSLYIKTESSFKKLSVRDGAPETGIIGITRRKWCKIRYIFKFEKERSTMAVWTKSEVYLGYSTKTFTRVLDISELRAILKFDNKGEIEVQSVTYTWHPLELAVLVSYCVSCTTTKKIYLLLCNEDSPKWILQDFQLEVPVDRTLTPYFLYSALPDLILWDAHSIYYFYKNFTISGILTAESGEISLSRLSAGSKIHNVITDHTGSILVKMENNVMFFFKSDITDGVKLHTWINTTTKTVLLINQFTKAYLLSYNSQYGPEPQRYPLYLELQSVIYKTQEQCPYVAFQHNIFGQFYFMDKGDSLKFWTQLVYPENIGLNIVVEHYGPNILTWTQEVSYEIASGFSTKSMLTSFSQRTNYELVDNYFKLQEENMGLVLIQFRPSETSKMCPFSKQALEITVGCDVDTHIKVKGFSDTDCYRRDFSYVIDKEFLRDKPLENLKIRYDVEEFGCPQRLEFDVPFQPVIELFDENGFVKIVQANFIVWEIHGRDDYTFNNTMKQSGCINEAQTFKSMIEENKDLPLDEVWGPHNYRTCFSYAVGKPGDLNQPYEIINYTNRNHLVWPMDHSGMYVFRVRILDPNFSFCNLTAIFAIETFGVIPRPSFYLVAALIFVLMLTFISILALSYFWYAKIYRQFIFEPLNKPPSKQKKK
ncbi:cation channel sperm-associated protein subunit epsilon [Arvicola amphibius]|uniref:cation channel sperm-associated protein subunit epsilon n=1 Tax=Arvicola amphibius TaxID=1047088 RepID=UPI001C095444|nr:cation channel sperm-associated protein subunit epsilon [Arvicola amphibius]